MIRESHAARIFGVVSGQGSGSPWAVCLESPGGSGEVGEGVCESGELFTYMDGSGFRGGGE